MKIIHTPTQQQFHDVQTKAFGEGYRWIDGTTTHLDCNGDENRVIYLDDDKTISHSGKGYAEIAYPTTPIISAGEYLSTTATVLEEYTQISADDWGKMYVYATTTTSNYLTNKSLIEKSMDTIKNAFKSKEAKAFEHFGYGSPDDINDAGLRAFQHFTYATGSVDKKEFIKKVVELYLEAVK